jgi:DNA recombination protein RmuC
MTFEILLVLVLVLGLVLLYFALRQLVSNQQQRQIEEVVDKVFGMSAGKVAEQSRQILQSEKEAIKTDLANKQDAIEKLVRQLQDDIGKRQEEIRELERDRTRKFSELNNSLAEHRKIADELKVSTQQLAKVLSNNQQRGEWGERIIEDLLSANGLKEGVHYARQLPLGDGTLRPDISLLLPNDRVVAVDVKFPYQEMQKMTIAETKSQQQVHLKQFRRDIKDKIDKVAKYILPGEKTLDYAILFVPNEMLFSFINQKFPDLIDEAMAKRVLVVSPFTFLIVARTVMESYRNFMIGDKLKEIVGYVDEFVDEWGKFRDKFEKYGNSIDRLQRDYQELTGTRVRQMERRIEKINSYRDGNLLPTNQEELLSLSEQTENEEA